MNNKETRFYEYFDTSSHKYWEASVEGDNFSVRFDSWGSPGRVSTRKLESAEKARCEFDKACAKKEKAGYKTGQDEVPILELEYLRKSEIKKLKVDYRHPEALELICEITSLEHLVITYGDMPIEMPESLGKLSKLGILELTNVARLPDSLGKLDKLRILSCSGLRALPDSIGDCISLDSLWLEQCQLESLPESIGKLSNLAEFKLRSSELEKLPESIGNLAVRTFEIEETNIVELPESIGNLSRVKRMELRETKLKHLPESFGNLSTLKKLILDDTPLEALPDSFGKLSSLELIQFKGWEPSPIESLPDSFRNLTSLTRAIFQSCSFQEIPEVLRDLPALEEVDFQLCSIPENIPEDLLNDKVGLWEKLGWVAQTNKETLQSDFNLSPVNEKERREAAKKRRTGFDRFRREMGTFWSDKVASIPGYALGESENLPVLSGSDVEHIHALHYAFAPYNEWSFVDRRLLAICANHWCAGHGSRKKGLQCGVCLWLADEMSRPHEATIPGTVGKQLEDLGVSSEAFAVELMYYGKDALVKAGGLTAIGSYLAQQVPLHGEYLLEEALKGKCLSQWVEVLLLSNQHKAYLDRIFPAENTFVTLEVFAVAMRVLPEEFIDRLLAFQKSSDASSHLTLNTVAQLLFKYGGKQYRETSLLLARQGLRELSSSLNNQLLVMKIDIWRKDEEIASYIEWLLQSFGTEAVPAVELFIKETRGINLDVISALVRHIGQAALPSLIEALKINVSREEVNYFARLFAIMAPLDITACYPQIWELTECAYPEIVESSARLLATRVSDICEDLCSKLASNDVRLRKSAAVVARIISVERAFADSSSLERLTSALKIAFSKETDEDVRDELAESVYTTAVAIDVSEAEARIEAAMLRGRLKVPPKAWMKKGGVPGVGLVGSKLVKTRVTLFLLDRQARIDSYRVHPELRDILPLLNADDLRICFEKLFRRAVKNGGVSAKNRGLLSLLASQLPASLVPVLAELGLSRNEHAIAMLGMSSSMESARALEAICRAFPVKYPNIRGAAEQGLADIAQRMGVSYEELRIELLPELVIDEVVSVLKTAGLDAVGILTPALKVGYVGSKGEVSTTIPKEASASSKARLKAITKSIASVAKTIVCDIDGWITGQRRWSSDRWQELFLQRPTLHAVSQGLVWQLVEDGEKVLTFIVNANKTLETSKGTKVSLLEQNWQGNYEMLVGMVQPKSYKKRNTTTDLQISVFHPAEGALEDVAAWKAVFSQRKIEQAVAQLNRPVYLPLEEELNQSQLYRFEGIELDGHRFKKQADALGWRRGSVVDAGEVSSYTRSLEGFGIDAHISLQGLNVGNNDSVTLKALSFVPTGSIEFGSYFYDDPRSPEDGRLIQIGKLPPIAFSEIIMALVAMTE